MNLEEDDELIGAKLARADDDILMISALGQAVRFTVTELRSASRTSGGVRGMRLPADDTIVSLNLTPEDSELLVVTEKGFWEMHADQRLPTPYTRWERSNYTTHYREDRQDRFCTHHHGQR